MQYDPSIDSAGVVPLRKEGGEWKVFLLQHRGYEPFWGCPKGHRISGETHEEAAGRELKEETGLRIKSFLQKAPLLEEFTWVKKEERLLKRILFFVAEVEGEIDLQKEEITAGQWFTITEAVERVAHPEGKATLKQVEHILKGGTKPPRVGASVNAYLILKQNDEILLHLRKNTGYCDGMWSLVAGHIESGESATEGMVREVKEEIGIELHPAQLEVVHTMHRKTNRANIDLFFACPSWQGEIRNCEPHKCEKLEFFGLSALPSNMIDYIAIALRHILDGKFYSELGWEE